ncbi:GrpB family protein [Paenibacillus sp. IHBB 3054]|uniref:GrpB family protein n=1 Tax=Paenibacillus sp. IHBB 3054 TaxID=3425689 RepID=UPI003F6777AB
MTDIAVSPVPIEVVPYNPVWKVEFSRIKERMLEILGDLVITVEHVGSTSIEGLAAKPIIDLDVVMESYEALPDIIERFREFDYVHLGNLGIEGREVFECEKDDGLMHYHLYVCPKDGKGYLEHIAFRDYLRSHPAAVQAYEKVKLALAEQYRNDREAYTEGKTAFVHSILNKAMQ